jgi:hypothetical protein
MYLDKDGEAFFLREVDADEAIFLESGDDIDDQSLRSVVICLI